MRRSATQTEFGNEIKTRQTYVRLFGGLQVRLIKFDLNSHEWFSFLHWLSAISSTHSDAALAPWHRMWTTTNGIRLRDLSWHFKYICVVTAYFVDLFLLSTFYPCASEFSHTRLQTPSIFGPFKCRFISRTNAQHNTTQHKWIYP